jgi:hypothetical protein
VVDLHGEELKEWIQFAREEMGITVKDDQIKDRRVHSLAFFSHGWILATSHEPQSTETIQILERFASVFNLTYRRFLDLEKAEAQAREAQIESALEKVRSRSLAMHKSDELQEVVNTVFERLTDLNIEMDSANIAIFHEGKRDFEFWIGSHFQKKAISFHIAEDWGYSIIQELINARENKQDFFSKCFSFEEKNDWFNYAFENTDFKNITIERRKYILESKAYALSIAFSKHTGVQINNYSGKLPFQGEIEILKRFAKVFEQAYIRFLDLEKAEAQAREAQIEASLERVRSKTMAMHNSQDVGETVAVLFDELRKLDVETLRCGVGIMQENYQMELWTARPDATGKAEFIVGHIDMKLHPLLTGGYEAWKNRAEGFFYQLKDEDLKTYFDAINSHRAYAAKYDISSLPSLMFHYEFNFNEGCLFAFSIKQFSDESVQIFKRFTGVFGQTYRRYLDLQKAEAQARESQIEASLERVRSKTMAMHKSDELLDIIIVVSEQLQQLNIKFGNVSFGVNNQNYDLQLWMAVKGYRQAYHIHWTFLDNPGVTRLKEAQQQPEKVYSDILTPAENNEWLQHIFNCNPALEIFSDEARNKLLNTRGYARSIAVMKDIFLVMGNYAAVPYTDDENTILKRFANVFEQAYKRFIDLQKAEAQAKEAQIEAALERVRAKAMAMHKSDDLNGAVTIMFEEFQKLNLDILRCGIGILNKDSRTGGVWATSVSDTGLAVQISANESFDTHPLMTLIYESWQKQEDLAFVLQGQDLIDYYQAMERSELKLPKSQSFFSEGELQPQYYYAAMFTAGGLYAFRDKPFATEDRKIMKRFASVVNLTYNRFLDLQKAEANAREAKIEAGLERVRARTMAMHSSEDVSAATATMFTELERLGIENFRGGITNIHPDRTQDVWSVNNLADRKIVKAVGIFNMDDHPFWQHMYKEWMDKKDFVYTYLAGKEKEDYIKILNATQGYLPQGFDQFPDVHFQVYAFNEGGVWTNSLKPHTEEEKQIMKRFASVFSLTFRRYQDLKKAEAQAREATIEAALEKVRGKAMAMHDSNDLSVTASMIISELRKLGISPIRCGIGLLNKETNKAQLYTATSSADGDSLAVVGWVLLEGHPVLENIYENWLT